MKKLDRIGFVLNIVLGVLYCPFSLFSLLMMMASESTIGVTNALYISLVDIFCVICALIPLFCVAGIVLSVVLRKKHSVLSFVIQFLPLVIFALNAVLLTIAESII